MKFAAYYSYYNQVALTAYAHVGSFRTIEDAYVFLHDNHDAYAAADRIGDHIKHPKLLSIDCFVKHDGKRVYPNEAETARVRVRIGVTQPA